MTGGLMPGTSGGFFGMEADRPFSLSANVMKWIALVTMLIDHLTLGLLGWYIVAGNRGSEQFFGMSLATWYDLGRGIGRLAFPIFCFLLVEGFFYTKDRKKYLLRLFIFALISDLPFDLALHKTVIHNLNLANQQHIPVDPAVYESVKGLTFDPFYQNVFFTLLFGGIAISVVEYLRNAGVRSKRTQLLFNITGFAAAISCVFVAEIMRTDYGGAGVCAIIFMYFIGETGPGRVVRNSDSGVLVVETTRYFKIRQMIAFAAGVAILGIFSKTSEFLAMLDLFLIWFYDGTRGRQKKYFFYIFYPAHLIVIWLIWFCLM